MNVNLIQPTSGSITSVRTMRDLPGPRGLPVLGNALQLDTQKLHLILEQWVERYGSIYRINLAGKPTVVIADPDLNNQILRARPDVYRRMGAIEVVFKEMGTHGLFSAEGEEWKQQRRLTMQALSSKHLRSFFPTMTRVVERLQRRWQAAAHSGIAVDVQKDLMRLTVDVTTNLTFGYDMNTLEQEGDLIQDHLERVFPMMAHRLNSPIAYWRIFKLPADRALDRSVAEINKTIYTFIEQARQRMIDNPQLRQQPTNFLEAMLALEGTTIEGEEVARFRNEEIVGNVFTMLQAGEDTTANTLSWMLYYMALHPEVQRHMQDEADVVLGDSQTLLNLQDAERLQYIEAVANEAMRLRPVVPIIALETKEDVQVADVQIPRGTTLMLLTRPGMRAEQNFAQAEEFHPERWLPAPSQGCPFHGAHNRNVHIPFGNGPRICPGRSLALLEIKTAMAMICRNFDVIATPKSENVRELFAVVMMPKRLELRFALRS